MSLNKFADLTFEEFSQKYLGNILKPAVDEETFLDL